MYALILITALWSEYTSHATGVNTTVLTTRFNTLATCNAVAAQTNRSIAITPIRNVTVVATSPLEACVSTYTGQQKTEEYITYQCVSYDVKMNCIVNAPFVNYVTYKEVNVQCNWNEWR